MGTMLASLVYIRGIEGKRLVGSFGQAKNLLIALTLGSFSLGCAEPIDEYFSQIPQTKSGFETGNGSPAARRINSRQFIVGTSGSNIEMAIRSLGVVPFESNALYFTGREGMSVHTMYLLSKSFDLTSFDAVRIGFQYLLIDLNDSDTDGEFLKIEVCNRASNDCGIASGGLNISRINDNNRWNTVFTHDESFEDNGLHGRNHSLSDWKPGFVEIDLSEFQASDFAFRFSVRMRDGFNDNDQNSYIEDGVSIDMVVAEAIDYE
jgi:hypothetical protein